MEKYRELIPCSKCGGILQTKYDEEADQIKRTCVRCGYYYYERPLDSKEINEKY